MNPPKRYDTTMRRRFDVDTRATVAIAAAREEALRTLCTVVHVEFAGPSVPAPRVDMALQRLFRDYDAEIAKKSTQFPLAIWTQGMWTVIEDPRDSLPGDAVALSRIASLLRTAVVSRIVRPADETFGFSYHDDEKCRRLFLKLSGIIVEDEGRLDEEDPPIKKAPAECVDLAWGRLIPESEPEQIQVRLSRPLGAPD